MQKIVDYEIVTGQNFNHVVRHVKEGLTRGWQPFGALSVAMNPGTDHSEEMIMYTQAMVEYESI